MLATVKQLCTKWTITVFAIINLMSSSHVFALEVSTKYNCSHSFNINEYKYKFSNRRTGFEDVTILIQKNLILADYIFIPVQEPASADIIVIDELVSPDISVCKASSSNITAKDIYVTRNSSEAIISDIRISLARSTPIVNTGNVYRIYIGSDPKSNFSALEAVAIVPAIWFFNTK